VTVTTAPTGFSRLGAPTFQNSVDGQPYGHFDLGAALGGSFLGGGSPVKGIAVNHSADFLFTLSGKDLNLLTVQDFFSALSVGPGDGEGHKAFVTRFRGFVNRGSDKVPGVLDDPKVIITNVAPEPASLTLAVVGVAGLLGWQWKCRRRCRTAV
jgi:hypothetical protein